MNLSCGLLFHFIINNLFWIGNCSIPTARRSATLDTSRRVGWGGSSESQRLCVLVPFGKYTFIIYKASVAVGLLHLPREGAPFEGTPTAAADDAVGGERPRLTTDEGEVGFHTFANEAAAFDVEQAGGVVAHELHHTSDGKYAFLDESEHGGQRELHHRHTRRGTLASSFLVGRQMWCMVGGDGGDASVGEGSPQGIAVGTALHGGIAFDARAECGIVFIAEEKMRHAGF